MDTVLGLSLTPTTVGWVLAEGHGADGTILDHNELHLQEGRGVRAVGTASQMADEVFRVEEEAAANSRRLRVIGVTWNDAAAAEAALVMESLTDAGYDNIVPIRFLEAVETLALAIAPVIGFEQTAVCIMDHDWATVVMVDTHGTERRTATKQLRGGFDGLRTWLTGMFDRDGWRPGGVVVVGSDHDINKLSWQLEKVLPVPVFAQTMAQVTVARGAALAAARSTEFTDEQLVAEVDVPVAAPARPRQLSYTGAVTALAAGAVTFVSSLSLAVGIQLIPDKDSGSRHQHPSTPHIAEAIAPAVPPPPQATPTGQQTPANVGEPIAQPTAPVEQQGGIEPKADPNAQSPYLTRVLEHIPGPSEPPSP